MRAAAVPSLILMLVLWSSCRSDFETIETTGHLEFSRDTVFLDTVFSNLSTSTYSLKVYNRSGEDIFIPEISLARGESSLYRLNVDGIPGENLENIEILARDSIYIFIETTVLSEEVEETEFLYTDKLQFRSRSHVQEVPLITLVKDATFLFPQKDSEGLPQKIPIGVDESGEEQLVTGFFLNEDQLNLTGEKPYVIYGYAVVPPGKTLTIEAGSRLHFHSNSGIIVSEGASFEVKGLPSTDLQKMENEVIFQSDRLGKSYANIPGQWGTIWFQKGSENHLLEYVTIKNASLGILAEGSSRAPTPLKLKNVQIYNSAVSGLMAVNASITAENLVINNSNHASLHLSGGNYRFTHATITNYSQNNYRRFPAVYLENNLITGDAPLNAEFYNSIIFGNESRELGYNVDKNVPFNIYFSHSLIKFQQGNETDIYYDFYDQEIYNNIWLNEEPIFADPKENDLRLQENSAAIDRGDPEVAQQVTLDLLGTDRTSTPDLGAYEFIEPEQ